MAPKEEAEILQVDVDVAGTRALREVKVTNPNKLYFKAAGITKLELVKYYLAVADGALVGIRNRPIVLKRFVDGAEGEAFYQKRAPTNRPDWLRTITLSFPSGRTAEEIVVDDAAGLAWITNTGNIELHPHAVLASDLDHPNELRIDLDPGPGVQWYDVDYPDVADLRRQLFPARDNYRVIAASVTDPAWLTEVRSDRPTLMIAEGLTMYLTESDGVALLRRIVDTFGSGELQFDAFNRLGIKSQWMNAVVRRSGATLYWGINGPDDIVDAVPGVRLLAWESPFDSATFQDVAWYYRAMAGVMSLAPALRYMAQYHRYAF
jgi:hypothetical protein